MSPCVGEFYDLVSEWLQATGGNSGFLKYGANLIESVIDEIKPAKKNTLCVIYFFKLIPIREKIIKKFF